MDLFSLFLAIPIIILFYAVFYKFTTPNYIPKGPIGLPYIGYNPEPLTCNPVFVEKAKKYGPVWSYYRFGTLAVTLNDFQSIYDIFVRQGDKLVNRPRSVLQKMFGNYGLIFTNGELWHSQRRFALMTLRNLGFGKPILENGINFEVDNLVQAVREKNGQTLDMQFVLNNAVSNVISQLLWGRRFEYSDDKMKEIMNLINSLVTNLHPVTSLGIPMWLGRLAMIVGRNQVQKQRARAQRLRKLITELTTDHIEGYNVQEEPSDYVQAFTRKQEEDAPHFSDIQLLAATIDLFAAGMETSSNTVRWGILYCTLHPDIQEKAYQAIVAVCGKNSYPSLNQRPQLPYIEALLLEAQRIGNAAPLVMRETNDDIWYQGMLLPKGSAVITNLWAVHMSPETFPDPKKFSPERFLDEDTGRVSKAMTDRIMPFGAGKRVCLGESLARMELFLMFAALIQQFKFRLPPGKPLPSTIPNTGIVSTPKPFHVLIEQRES